MKLELKASAPIAVLVVAVLSTTALIVINPKAEPQELDQRHAVVRIVLAAPTTTRPQILANGTVAPRIESDLVAEVGGRVVWISPRFEAGAFFESGEELLRIERRDHEAAAERARAGVERAESQLSLAQTTLKRVERLRKRAASSTAAFEEATSNAGIAGANLRDAQAQLVQAELDLGRTGVRAPFAGRVRGRTAELGQFVNRGTSLAAIYAIDAAEVRLPVPADELAFLEVGAVEREGSLTERGLEAIGIPAAPAQGPRVVLVAPQAGEGAIWNGEIVRVEGALDDRTRMVNVVARVANPHAPSSGPPLTMGLFVEARIEGRLLADLVEIPRAALRPGGEVLVVDDDSRLRRRPVTVLRAEGDRVWLSDGLAAGERVCATPPPVIVEGMPVRVAEEPMPEATAVADRGAAS
jgi:RND family efflux transporter MFP subunit